MRRQLSIFCAVCTLVAAGNACAQGTKWHPGHYVMLAGDATVAQHMWQIDELQNDEPIQGFMVRFWWYDLEPALDEYDFSQIDTYLSRLRRTNTPKRLVVRIMDRRFFTDDASNIVPDYLREDPVYNGGLVRSGSGYVARLWEKPVMERLVRLYQALAQRYDADPVFDGVFTEETTLSFTYPDFPEGYSHELLAEQYVYFINAVKPMLPTSNLFLNANWIGSSTLMVDLVQAMRDASVGAGGSNVIPGSPTQGQRVLMGEFGADYRLELPIADGVEGGELGGALGDFTPEEIATYAYEELQAHYVFWARKTWGDSPEQTWYTGILPYLRSGPPIRTRCPNVYGICLTEDPPRPKNQAPEVSAGPDASTELPQGTLTLAGSATDDGLPGPMSIEWSELEGPEPVMFMDASSPTSAVTFTAAGTYVLRLTASDGELTASDDVTVTVSEPPSPTNQAPEVSAGPDASTELPQDTLTLAGSAMDDGLPGPMSIEWSELQGPEPVMFMDASSPTSAVTFTAAGTYVLRLTASDGELTASDDVTVTVSEPPPPEPPPPEPPPPEPPPPEPPPPTNRAPEVSAGPDASTELPQDTLTLAGSATDDGLPGPMSIEWSELNGPEPVMFVDASSPTSAVTFTAAGTYVLRLTASDGELTASDDVTVTVSEPTPSEPPAPPPSEPPGPGAGSGDVPADPPIASPGGGNGGGGLGLLELLSLLAAAVGARTASAATRDRRDARADSTNRPWVSCR